MILKELFYYDPNTRTEMHNARYSAERDVSELNKGDTRKVRLTLGQINELRKASDLHVIEQEKELGNSGRILVRASGTESLIRVMVEAQDMKTAQKIADSLAELVRSELR